MTRMPVNILSIPAELRPEYLSRQMSLAKSRLRVSCAVLFVLWIAAVFLAWFFYPEFHDPMRYAITAYLAASSIGIAYLSYRAKTSGETKFLCYLFVAIVIFSFALAPMDAPWSFSDLNFVLTLFFFAVLMPWSLLDLAWISLMHYIGWTVYFFSRDLSGYTLPPTVFGMDIYVNGLIYLLFAVAISYVARRKEISRDIRAFLLLKEVEVKKVQMEKELEFAARVQNTLVPQSTSTSAVDITVSYRPMGKIGGDYANYLFLNDHTLLFFISDVTGHGVPAALIVNRVHAEFETITKTTQAPGQILKLLNQFIAREFADTSMYLSALCGLILLNQKKLYYSSYGHLPQYLYRASTSQVIQLEAQATLLGLDASDGGRTYEAVTDFDRGDRLLLFTDGVPEIKSDQEEHYGEERVKNFFKETASRKTVRLGDSLLQEIGAFSGGHFEDDVFIMTIDLK